MYNLTKEQYRKLLTILENFQANNNGNVGDSSGNANRGSGAMNFANIASGAVNFAGIVACSSSIESKDQSYEHFETNADTWILDFGATNYMIFNKSMLTNTKTLIYPFLVTLPNGYKVKVTFIGDVILSPKFYLRKVFFLYLTSDSIWFMYIPWLYN